jgi:hypothetical protein
VDDEEVGFTTARELRETADRGDGREPDDADGTRASDEPTFDVDHPDRKHPRAGGMRYEGGTVFALTPEGAVDASAAVDDVLAAGPYRYGDWFDLPMPLFLVHDDEAGDTFRVAVRDGTVELHVRSATSPAGLRAFYDRLVDRVGEPVTVTRKADGRADKGGAAGDGRR